MLFCIKFGFKDTKYAFVAIYSRLSPIQGFFYWTNSFAEGTLIIEQHRGVRNVTKQFESPQQCFAITIFGNKQKTCL